MTDLDFSTFVPLPGSAWRELITRDLKGRAFDTLHWEVEPGIVLEPFATAETAPAQPIGLPAGRQAAVVQYLADADAAAARTAISEGAEALFVAGTARLPDDWPDKVRTYFTPNLEEWLRDGADQLDREVSVAMPRLDGLTLHEAGATRVETLAWVAAQASEWLHVQTREGIQPGPFVEVIVGIGPEFVPEVSFLRALRLVLANVARAYGRPETTFHLLGVTSGYRQTAYAPHNNLLRNTLAAAAALIGGVDALCIRPHDSLAGPTEAGPRLARQTHLLLREESHLGQVADAAGGAFSVEALTGAFSEAAWRRFTEIEQAGGVFEAARKLDLPQVIAEQHHRRQSEVLSGKRRIVGITRSPDPSDEAPALPEASDGPLAPRRLSEPFENLRAQASVRPIHAALLLFGDPAQRAARAAFSRDFLGTLGISAAEVQVKDELSITADLVVLCAGDDDYTADAVRAVRSTHAHVWVAGKPDNETALREAGAQFFLSARTPLYDHLRDALGALSTRV